MKSKCYQKVTAILIGFWEHLGEKSTLRPLCLFAYLVRGV